jgi:hypothetical protein
MIRAFWKLRNVDVGFDPRSVTAFSLQLPASRYQGPDRLRFASQLEERLAALPGIKAASFVTGLPPLRPINANDTDMEDYQATPDGPQENIDYWNTVNETTSRRWASVRSKGERLKHPTETRARKR